MQYLFYTQAFYTQLDYYFFSCVYIYVKKSIYTWALCTFCDETCKKFKVWQEPSTTFCSETHAKHFATKSSWKDDFYKKLYNKYYYENKKGAKKVCTPFEKLT